MYILISFAFLAGLVTILSPCILPILPVVLSGSAGGGKKRPLGIIVGFIGSFSFVTLFLTGIVQVTGVSPSIIRAIAISVLIAFGMVLLVPPLGHLFESLVSAPLNWTVQRKQTDVRPSSRGDFLSGIIVGMSTGLIWTPCVGPILASVIALALTGTVTGIGVLITLSYATGAAIPLLAIAYGGRALLQRVPWLLSNAGKIQKVFGIIIIATAIAIYFNLDRKLQASIAGFFPQYGAGLTKIEESAPVQRELTRLADRTKQTADETPELIPGGQWFNSQPLTLKELKGKVVLIDFWTYTCINCIRTLPFIKSLYARYKDKGLVVIGVHTPEFEFEKDPGNVGKAIHAEGITYPVMQDNDYKTWNAYHNRYWPAKYLIDANNKIRYTHFGEGGEDKTERAIQELLKESGAQVDQKTEHPQYSIQAQTPELYLGLSRMEALASPEPVTSERLKEYSAPKELPLNTFAFNKEWTIAGQWAEPAAKAHLFLHFNASQVFLVIRPQKKEAHIRVYLDGRPVPPDLSGADLVNSEVTVDADRLYHLIKLPKRGEHLLELEFPDGGVRLYAFTFG